MHRKLRIEGYEVLNPPRIPFMVSAPSEDWSDSVNSRETSKKRRLAYIQDSLPSTYASECEKADGSVLAAHKVELSALRRIEHNEHSAWDVLCAEALAEKCFSQGCAFDDGAIEDCPGWCGLAISGFEGWVMVS